MDKSEPKKFPSSIDVARRAGVSQSAVSRTFGTGSVSEATSLKVRAAAAELGYQPSAIPRIMLTHRSYLVAVAIGGMYNPFNSSILELFSRRLQGLGYQMLLVHVDDSSSLEAAMPKLSSYRVDAVFIARGVLNEASAASLAQYRIPIVAFHTPIEHDGVSSVCTDNFTAGQAMADHFHSKGARRCAFVGGSHGTTADRQRGFASNLSLHGLRPPAVVDSPFTYEGGRQVGQALLTAPNPPDAIFCGNDLIAIGCLDTARELGLDVPGDVMIAGFDDIPEAGWYGNSLTTFAQSDPNMVDASIRILQDLAEAKTMKSSRTVVPVKLIERSTTNR